jgi:glycosyltransferase involved in cell wall biosynthesis
VIRKALRILREDGPVVMRRRAGRYVQRKLSSKSELELLVAIDDVLAADWQTRGANDEAGAAATPRSLTINWVIPVIGNGSGGHRTILRLVKLLEERGHTCRIVVYDGRGIQTAEEARAIIARHFPSIRAEVRGGGDEIGDCDALIATAWNTAYPVFNASTRARKFYFVQDYEPSFYATGTESILAENTYRFGLDGITAGAWLSEKLSAEFGMRCDHFDFGSDAGQYAFENAGERKKVVFYARPSTPRRGFELGVLALALFARAHPEYEIHMVGADLSKYELPFEFVDRGILTPAELNELYNESAAALVISLTNMSLLPLELLAAGCIPVVNKADSNTKVSDNPFIFYAETSPQALARALGEAVSRPDLGEHSRAAANSVRELSWGDAAEKVEGLLRHGVGKVPAAAAKPVRGVTISAVVGAYNSERWIGETLDAMLGQTRPPHEVIVVDDGSTDGTPAVLDSYGDAIRVVRKENGGCPSAFNRAFTEATGDYVAMCGADDVWEPRKLEWQAGTLEAQPEVDVSFGAARSFGLVEAMWPDAPGTGVLDRRELLEALFSDNFVCASSVTIRRSLALEIGPFVEHLSEADDRTWTSVTGLDPDVPRRRFSADDYDYWLRALRAGAVFHYDPRELVRYRRHEENATTDILWVGRSAFHTRRWHADQVEDRSLVRSVQAQELFQLGRQMIDAGQAGPAQRAFRASLGCKPMPRGAAWMLLSSLPEQQRSRLTPALKSLKRSLVGLESE